METSHHQEEVHLSMEQFQALDINVDTLARRAMENHVEINGQLTLPPQSQAAVTSIIGANIASVEVIEGNKVNKGQPLAYMFHPNLIKLQTEYANQVNQLEYVEREYQRQEKLYQESVGSGRDFQKVKADYLSLKGTIVGMEAQLKLLQISPQLVKSGKIYERIPLTSPIAGYVQRISVRTGQYVAPEEVLFEVIQNDHIHAHFKVFESDIQNVKEGQIVQFIVGSQPQIQHKATVFSVGKMFESDVKAINVHAELENEDGSLLPGMYVRGHIILDEKLAYALPKEAVAMDGDRNYIFKAEQEDENGTIEWHFTPMEISVGVENDGWLAIMLHQKIEKNTRFAWNNAYYLISELRKDEAEHDH
jgi:cobalt-zinc-cadmium efflux system membrane fusion protein